MTDVARDTSPSEEYTLDRLVVETIRDIALCDNEGERFKLEARLQELLARRSRLMRPAAPSPAARPFRHALA